MKAISFEIPEEDLEKVRQTADDLDVSQSALLRSLVREFLEDLPSVEARGTFLNFSWSPMIHEELDVDKFLERLNQLEKEVEVLKEGQE